MAGPDTLNDYDTYDANVTRSETREKGLPKPVSNEYDYVLSFFKDIMRDESIAENFTESLYEVSQNTGHEVLVLLQSLEGQNAMQVNETMAFYLNNIRSPSTMFGVQNIIRPNYYAGRNVLG